MLRVVMGKTVALPTSPRSCPLELQFGSLASILDIFKLKQTN